MKCAGFEDAQIKACTIFSNRQLHPVGASDSSREIGAGDARTADLNERSAQTHLVAYADLIFGDAVEGEIFADIPGFEVHVVLGVPEGVVIRQMDADRCARTSVIGLGDLVFGESLKGDRYRAIHAIAKDGGSPSSAFIGDGSGLAGEDCLDGGGFRHVIDFRLTL